MYSFFFHFQISIKRVTIDFLGFYLFFSSCLSSSVVLEESVEDSVESSVVDEEEPSRSAAIYKQNVNMKGRVLEFYIFREFNFNPGSDPHFNLPKKTPS